MSGQEYHAVIRPIRLENLTRYTTALPTLFSPETQGGGDSAAALEFMRAILVAGIVEVRGPGGPYKVGLQSDYERRVLEPEDLEEPGLQKSEPYANCNRLLQEILALSGMEALFRSEGNTPGDAGADRADGPAPAPAGS
ncbi:hypothetical protein [Thermus scotoductus]|uniref:hypothetical protein n=1 Tax=Thermus scotoductus TaxID=37636 RepID=UPI000F7E9918|nr:hypothetical protein [Thermus scotoductus]